MISEYESRPHRMRVLFGLFSMFSNFYRLDFHNKTCVPSSKSYKATPTNTALKIKPILILWLSKEHVC